MNGDFAWNNGALFFNSGTAVNLTSVFHDSLFGPYGLGDFSYLLASRGYMVIIWTSTAEQRIFHSERVVKVEFT